MNGLSLVDRMIITHHPLAEKVAVVAQNLRDTGEVSEMVNEMDVTLMLSANGLVIMGEAMGIRGSSVADSLARLATWAYENPVQAEKIWREIGLAK